MLGSKDRIRIITMELLLWNTETFFLDFEEFLTIIVYNLTVYLFLVISIYVVLYIRSIHYYHISLKIWKILNLNLFYFVFSEFLVNFPDLSHFLDYLDFRDHWGLWASQLTEILFLYFIRKLIHLFLRYNSVKPLWAM